MQRRWTPAVKGLVIVNCAVYVLQILAGSGHPGSLTNPLVRAFAFRLEALRDYFAVWQFVSYMFLHGNMMHILFNMLGLWMFGSEVERYIGTRRFLRVYFGAGILGALVHGAIELIMGQWSRPMLGASAGCFGIFVLFGIYFGNAIVLAFLFIPMRARTAVIVFVVISLVSGVQSLGGGGSNVADFAHLGGALFGYLYVKGSSAFSPVGRFMGALKRRLSPRFRPRWEKPPPAQTDKRLEAEVDRILDKIHERGVSSLSDEERRILDEASRKL